MDDLQAQCRIAMITDDFIPGMTGVGVHVQKLSREMTTRGHQVVVITTRRHGQPQHEEWEGVKIYRVFSIPMYGFYQALPSKTTIKNILLENHINIVHCHYLGIMMLRAMDVAEELKIARVLTAHMTVDVLTQPLLMRPWKPLLRRFLAHIYERFNHVICVSSQYARQVKRFNLSSHIHFISNAIDFIGTEALKESPADVFRILYVGRLTPEKNIGLLLRAISIVARKNKNIQLSIIGQGTEEKELRALTASLKIEPYVSFVGHVAHKDLPKAYAACDVFVLPSTVETQGLVALEAMRFKCPVIVTNRIISAQELIAEGENGFIVDSENAEDMAKRLDQLSQNPQLRLQQGEAGFRKTHVYTGPVVCDAIERVYRSISVDATIDYTDLDIQVDKRHECVFCKIGTFEKRRGHIMVGADTHRYQEEYFVIWRCATCRSLHSLAKFSLEDYYRHSPYLKRHVNMFNRHMFKNFYNFIRQQGLKENDRLLFCGVSASLFKEVFESQGQMNIDVIDQPRSTEAWLAEPIKNYDAVVLMEHLECAEDPRVFLNLVSRQLRPGGSLIIHTPDANHIKLTPKVCWLLHQPFRIHVASLAILEEVVVSAGFKTQVITRYHYMDTAVPFINFHTFQELPFFGDATVDAAIEFKLSHLWRAWWRLPRFLFWGVFGGIFRDQTNLTGVFLKNE